MALFDLVEYFNDRFEREHRAKYRPLVIENNRVYGVFGQLRIHSIFSPLRETVNPKKVSGHAVKIKVSAYEAQHLHSYEIENLAKWVLRFAVVIIALNQFCGVLVWKRRGDHRLRFIHE